MLGIYLSSCANKSTEHILVGRESEDVSMDVLPACLLVVIQHCKNSPYWLQKLTVWV